MNYEIVNLEEKKVIGMMVNTTNANGKAMSDIGELWGRFLGTSALKDIKNLVNNKSIGLYTDYECDFTKPYNFLACCEVAEIDEVPEDMVGKKIEAGKYAKFIIKGDVQFAVGQFWSELWNMNLDRRYESDFEEYQNDSDDMKNTEIHIYIGLN